MTSESKMREKQTTVPATVSAPPPPKMPADEAIAFLKEAGWVSDGSNDKGDTVWIDPAGLGSKRGVQQVTRELPTDGGRGEPMPLRQTVVPPCAWSYPLQEACSIQRARDGAANKQQAVA